MVPPSAPDGPGRHITVTHAPTSEQPALWRNRAVRVTVGLASIAAISWWYGFTAAGIVLAAGALLFLLTPASRQRMTNSVAAHRQDRWVSPPVRLDRDTRPHLLLIDRYGLELAPGTTFDASVPPAPQFPWSEITALRLEGPPGRPAQIRVESTASVARITGPFPSALLDELARYGVPLPRP